MNESSPLFSCLCVTEKRTAFLPWLLWNFDRQTWPNKELVLIDSSAEPARFERADVRVIAVPPGATVPEKRNLALREARGQWLAWFDDDDWQHPDRLRRLAGALVEGAEIAGISRTALLDLRTCGVQRYEEAREELIFNAVGLTVRAARSRAFEPTPVVGSEILWLSGLCNELSGAVRRLPNPLLTLLLCHHSNLCNPPHKWQLTGPLESLVAELGEEAWAETDAELDALRERVDEQIANEWRQEALLATKADAEASKHKPYQLFGHHR
jgi:hypothetical protein